jgi:MoaA/NifB/PqqE/SkfB family radical SAM enzyme
LQISIDNVNPDEVSKKSLKVLDRKLTWLADYAEFDVNINAVVGAGIRNPEDALVVAARARELGLAVTTGVIHDGSAQLRPLGEPERRVLDEIANWRKPVFSFARHNRFQENLRRGIPNDWRCHAGSRYLYVCEDGLVHWCSQQRGYPGIPLEKYSVEDIRREYSTVKQCAPLCTINCVHQTAILDNLRERPHETIVELLSGPTGQTAPSDLPASVRLLSWMFLSNRKRGWFTRTALRVLGVK